STFIPFFLHIYPFSSTFIPYFSTFIPFPPHLSLFPPHLSLFLHIYPFSSTFIPFSSTFIPFSSTFIPFFLHIYPLFLHIYPFFLHIYPFFLHIYPFSSTFIPFSSTFIPFFLHIYPFSPHLSLFPPHLSLFPPHLSLFPPHLSLFPPHLSLFLHIYPSSSTFIPFPAHLPLFPTPASAQGGFFLLGPPTLGAFDPQTLFPAPEILHGCPYGPEVDMWSVGVITYILLCGFEPFFDPRGDQYMYSRILTCDYEFVSPWWDEVSPNAKDLVRKLIVLDPQKRLTVQQALEHPWVTGKAAKFAHMDSTQRKLQEFNARRKLKAAMKAVVASSRLGNHGHHDCSRSGRAQGGPRGLARPAGTGGPEASAELGVFQSDSDHSTVTPVTVFQSDTDSDHSTVTPVAVPGASCDS
ncbi:uncharacterized protein LOC111944618, partial [Cyanistes caeruleus]